MCTLKVAEPYRGQWLGELLVKAALEEALDRGHSAVYVTVFEQHDDLVSLLSDLGFEEIVERTALGELILVRSLSPPADAFETMESFRA